MRRSLSVLALLASLLACGPRRTPATAASEGGIVSTTPSITELLFALGLGPRVAGVTIYCRYPEEARRLPKVGTYIQPDLEAIAALRPALVVVQKNPVNLAGRLERLGLRVLELEYDSIPQTYAAIIKLAAATGASSAAEKLNAGLRDRLDAISGRTATMPRRSVMFVVGRNPGGVDGLIAAGRASYLNELLQIAGGTNIFGDSPIAYPKINPEALVARDPEVIIDMGEMASGAALTEAERRAAVALWDKMPGLRAVMGKRVYPVTADHFAVPGPRMAEAAAAFARMLHPEAAW